MSGVGNRLIWSRIGHQVAKVADDHQVPHRERLVQAAGRIGNEQVPDTQRRHHADGKGDLFHRIPFVIVEPALHGANPFSGQVSHNEVALVANGRRLGEMRNLGIRDHGFGFDDITQFPQAAAQHDADFGRLSPCLLLNEAGCFADSLNAAVHDITID